MRTQSIRRRLLADHVFLILLLGGAILATTFLGARRAVETLSRGIVERAADQAEGELRRFFDPVAGAILALGQWHEVGLLDGDDPRSLVDLVAPVAARLPQVSGVLVADGRGREHFLTRGGDGGWRSRLTRVDEWGGQSRWLEWSRQQDGEPAASSEEVDYDPRSRPWYQGALARGAGADSIYWTEPYVFFTAQRPGITASLAVEARDRTDRVVAIDVLLDDLSRFSRAIEVSERGSVWVVTDDRKLLAWPDDPELWADRDPATALLRSPRELGLTLVDDATEALAGIPLEQHGEPVRFTSGGEDWWASGRRFALSDERSLLAAVAVPHADLLGERARLRAWILGLTLAALLAAVARAFALAGRFSRPIEDLARHSERIGRGDLEPGRPVVTGLAEVRQLADAHEHMRRGLETLMKLEDDLQLARQIQQKTFPRELPRLSGFDLVAWNRPADETGGDSYDAIGLDADGAIVDGEAPRALLMLADATGHGIGPALSVTQLRAMLRMAVRLGGDLATVAAHLNEQLYADLPGNRFITAWLGELEADRGELATFSAGQAPLLLYRAARDEVEVMNADAPPFGLLPDLPIAPPPPIALEPGDIYTVLSDGFFEAVDAAGMEFGKERIIELVRRHRRAGAADILAALRAAVRDFTGGAPPDDDRTALIVKRSG